MHIFQEQEHGAATRNCRYELREGLEHSETAVLRGHAKLLRCMRQAFRNFGYKLS